LKSEEFAQTAEDILWRRSKLGLHLKPEEIDGLKTFLAARGAPAGKTTDMKRRRSVKVPS